MTRRRMLTASALVLTVAVVGVFTARRALARSPLELLGDTTSAPSGQRVVVEVLNASGVTGLARRATFLLRDRGFDVVGWGNDPNGRRGATLIIDYTDKPEAAVRLARILGGASIERGKDSLDRGLDITVKLGSNYKPSAEAFHP